MDAHPQPLTGIYHGDFIDQIFFFVSKKNRCAQGGQAIVTFCSRAHDYFASFKGSLNIDNSPSKVSLLFNKTVEPFFPNGPKDPELMLMRFDIEEAELWESDLGKKNIPKLIFGGKGKQSDLGLHAVVTTTNVYHNPDIPTAAK